MTLKVTPALRFVFIVFFLGVELLVVFVASQLIGKHQLGIQEILMLLGLALMGVGFLLMLRTQLFIGDKYVEYQPFLPGMKRVTIRAVDVDKIERSAVPFIGRVDYIRMKGGKEMHNIPTDMLERRKEVPALLEKALHTKIIE